MKRQYATPVCQTIKLHTENILAGSFDENTNNAPTFSKGAEMESRGRRGGWDDDE